MAIRTGFFNSVGGDRRYDAKRFAEYFATFIGNGVFPNPSDALQVMQSEHMSVKINPGTGWINGYYIVNDADYILDIEPADGVLNRIDRVVLRYDEIERDILIKIKKGKFATHPTPPDVQRDEDAYEIALADVTVGNGVISISQPDIKDLRLNKELCGIVHGLVDQVDTTTIFNQYTSWFDKVKSDYNEDIVSWTESKKYEFDKWYNENTKAFLEQWRKWFNENTQSWEKDFTEWFDKVKGQLDGDLGVLLTRRMEKAESEILDIHKQLKYITEYDVKTYSELWNLQESEELIPGKSYMISDYKTIYVQPESDELKECDIEPLIVTAINEHRLSSIAFSQKYPTDIIIYDFDNNICEDKKTVRPGVIVRRTGTITNNSAPGDWRNMTWARWKPHPGNYFRDEEFTEFLEWAPGENARQGYVYRYKDELLLAISSLVPDTPTDSRVFISIYKDINEALLRNDNHLVYVYEGVEIELAPGDKKDEYTFRGGCKNNVIEGYSILHNNTFSIWCSNNRLSPGCHGNSFGSNCQNNTLQGDCYHNVFMGYNHDNTLKQASFNNHFAQSASINDLGSSCISNILCDGCNSNAIQANCRNIRLGASCKNNVFGPGCDTITVGDKSQGNTFKSGCEDNILGYSCMCNEFGANFKDNVIKQNCVFNVFGSDCKNNKIDHGFSYNAVGNGFSECTISSLVQDNVFGNSISNLQTGYAINENTFGNRLFKCTVGNGISHCVFGNKLSYCTFEGSMSYCKFHTCRNITVGKSASYLRVDNVDNKDLLAIDIYDKPYNIDIFKRFDGVCVFSYLNKDNQLTYWLIP